MNVTFDMSELDSFGERLADIGKRNQWLKQATREVADMLRRTMIIRTPFETGTLRAGWSQNGIHVEPVSGGFQVQLVNPVEYATWVNDGHRVRNRKDGDYLKVRNRVKVPVARKWQKNTSDWYVYGHFFVESSIMIMKDQGYLEKIIMENLEKWMRWCCD